MRPVFKNLVGFVLPLWLWGCSKTAVNETLPNGNGGSGAAGSPGLTLPVGGAVTTLPPVMVEEEPKPCADPKACTDFPENPILESGVPSNAPGQFAAPPMGVGPCILEPEDGAIYPYNWLRPRIRWTGASGLTRITLTTAQEKYPLVAYTNANAWTLPKAIWQGLASHVRDQDISVEVRTQTGGATTVHFRVAPVGASGSIVFWAADPTTVGKQPAKVVDGDSMLKGFSVGEEGTVDALVLSQVQQLSRDQSADERKPQCMGCHVATPDPGFVAFIDHWPWNTVVAGIRSNNVGASLPNLTSGGLSALNKPWSGMPTFSKAHWQPGNRLMVSTSAQSRDSLPWSTETTRPTQLVWFNLDSPNSSLQPPYLAEGGKNYGVIARRGDTRGVAFPTWSPDGNTLVYCSTDGGNQDGRLEQGATHLYSVPFNRGSGGDAKPIPGAAEPGWEEYYPAFSPDGKYLLFDRVPAGERMYANPKAEVFAIPLQGGTALRLASNTPPACSQKTSPGINNHFPRWSPSIKKHKNKTYYWFIFSSNRMGLPTVTYTVEDSGETARVEVSQLYLSLIIEEDGVLSSYPSIYLWNQSTTMVNTTPIWDVLEIPPVIIP